MIVKTSLGVVILTASVSVVFCVYLNWKNRQRNAEPPAKWRKVGFIKTLLIYPLKSGHYNEEESAECTEIGLRTLKSTTSLQIRDRLLVVYAKGEIKLIASKPKLLHIKVAASDRNHITLDAPQMNTLFVEIPQQNGKKIRLLNKYVVDCGDEASRWLSKYLAQKDSGYNLGYFYDFIMDQSTELLFDSMSLLLLNQQSMNDYLNRAPKSNITGLNFRPNVIVDGADLQPYEEDHWDWLKIGNEVILRKVKDCARCFATSIDPITAKPNPDREPIKTLSKYRMSDDPVERAPIMGIYLEVNKTGIINVGDPVYLGDD